MTKNGNTREKTAARRVQNTLGIPYTAALNALRAAKADDITWDQAADILLTGESE